MAMPCMSRRALCDEQVLDLSMLISATCQWLTCQSKLNGRVSLGTETLRTTSLSLAEGFFISLS